MSLIARTPLPLIFHVGLVFADNSDSGYNGGLDGGVDDSDKDTKKPEKNTKQKPTDKETVDQKTIADTNTEVAKTDAGTVNTDIAQTAANTNKDTTTKSARFNQWGFTGSQQSWVGEKTDTSTESESASTSASSTTKSSKNKTSNAARTKPMYAGDKWKHSAFFGAFVAVTMALHCL